MAINQNLRSMPDANLQVTVALPAANANVTSAGIDVRSGGAGSSYLVAGSQSVAILGNSALEQVLFTVDIPALAAATDASKNVNAAPYDSDDNISFAAITGLTTQSVAGVATTGSAATTLKWVLPPNTRRYVAAYVSVDNGGPAVTASSATVSILC